MIQGQDTMIIRIIKGQNALAARILLGLFCIFAVACEKKQASWEGSSLRAGQAETKKFGSEAEGFIEWLDPSARFVAYYQFREDSDGDGTVNATLGDHGEPLGDRPTAYIRDLDKGTEFAVDTILEVAPDGRHLSYVADSHLHVFSNQGQKRDLGAAPPADLANPCLPPRQGRFDATGTNFGYFADTGFTTITLEGSQRRTEPVDQLWRAEPTPAFDWTHRAETDSPPKVSGTCVCRWCTRFATSMGRYRFEGEATTLLRRADGKTAGPSMMPVASDWLADVQKRAVTNVDGKPHECSLSTVFIGAQTALGKCGGQSTLVNLSDGSKTAIEDVDVKSFLEFPVKTADGKFVLGHRQVEGKRHLAGLNVESGQITVGPAFRRVATPHPSGWVTASDEKAVYLFNLATGQTITHVVVSKGIAPLAFATDAGWHAVDPTTGRFIKVTKKPDVVSDSGCVVEPANSAGKLDVGPWSLICPR